MKFFSSRNYNLLRELVITDFKLRYQGSVLGYLWSLAKPMMLFGVLYFVFAKFFKFGSSLEHYPEYLLLGVVMWTYFTEATTNGLSSIVGRGDLLRKISFPKYIVVFSTSVAAFINLMLNLMVVAIFMALDHVPIHPNIIVLPIFLLALVIVATACSFLLSALFVRYRDISYIWEVLLQVMFYATPIIYPLSFPPPQYAEWIALNPLAWIIQGARAVTIGLPPGELPWNVLPSWAGPVMLGVVAAFVLVSALYFRSHSKHFAEEI